jgi:hypothetical protein
LIPAKAASGIKTFSCIFIFDVYILDSFLSDNKPYPEAFRILKTRVAA